MGRRHPSALRALSNYWVLRFQAIGLGANPERVGILPARYMSRGRSAGWPLFHAEAPRGWWLAS
jgi:hypothetical protein